MTGEAAEPDGSGSNGIGRDLAFDADAFLAALRLSDSFLPLGTHTASYGLEQYLNDGAVDDADELRALLAAYLHRVVGPCEVVALGAAHDAANTGLDDAASTSSGETANTSGSEGETVSEPDRVLAADRRLHAVTLPREFRESSTTAGARLLELLDSTGALPPVTAALAEAVEAGETPGHFAVALGTYAAEIGIGRDAACLLHGYAFLSDQLGAAQRLGRFGHTAIQRTLAALLEEVRQLPDYADRDLASMGSFAPLVELAGIRHERAERRLFVS